MPWFWPWWRGMEPTEEYLHSSQMSQRIWVVFLGGVMGLFNATYLVWLNQAGKGVSGGTPEEMRSLRLLMLFRAVATAVASLRLRAWCWIPGSLKPRIARALGSIYSPARQENALFTLPYSHYCEKARWALELSGESFTEFPVAPFMLRITAQLHSGGKNHTLPLMISADEKVVLEDSTAILDYLFGTRGQVWLYPNKEARELETFFGQSFGRPAFHVAYHYLFSEGLRGKVVEIFGRKLPRWQRVVLSELCPGLLLIMSKFMRLEERLSYNIALVEEAFRVVEDTLSDGRRYLCGASISAADITFASLAYPVVLPDETANHFVAFDPDALPEGYAQTTSRLRETEAGKFVLRLFREERWRHLRYARHGPGTPLAPSEARPAPPPRERQGSSAAVVAGMAAAARRVSASGAAAARRVSLAAVGLGGAPRDSGTDARRVSGAGLAGAAASGAAAARRVSLAAVGLGGGAPRDTGTDATAAAAAMAAAGAAAAASATEGETGQTPQSRGRSELRRPRGRSISIKKTVNSEDNPFSQSPPKRERERDRRGGRRRRPGNGVGSGRRGGTDTAG